VGSNIHQGMGTFEGYVSAYCNVPTHDCIAHCSPAAAGVYGCLAHTAEECIRRRASRRKWAMRPLARLLWTLVITGPPIYSVAGQTSDGRWRLLSSVTLHGDAYALCNGTHRGGTRRRTSSVTSR